MRWICDTCCPPGGDGVTITPSFPRYEDWILHLLSGDHEEVMRANLMTRVRRTEDNTGFVVTFAKSRVGTLPNRLQLLEYFGTFGCITQFYYDEGARFCFVRVDPMFSGCQTLREGQYLINEVHVVTCLKVRETSDTYWRCLLERKTPVSISGCGPRAGLPLSMQINGNGDNAVVETPGHLMNATTIIDNRNSPCLFDTRQMLENNALNGIPNGAQSQTVMDTSSPIMFTAAAAGVHQTLQQQHMNYGMHQYSPAATYPAHLGGGVQMMPPYPAHLGGGAQMMSPYPQQHQQQSSLFFASPPIPNQQHQQYDNYYRQFPTLSSPSPNILNPQTPLQQMPFNNEINGNFKVIPQTGRNYNSMHQPQFPGHPSLMQQPAPASAPLASPPPGFRPLQTLDHSETGRHEETKSNPVGVSIIPEAGNDDDDFLRKLRSAFGAASLEKRNLRSNLSVAVNSNATSIVQSNNVQESPPAPPEIEQRQLINTIKENLDHLLLPPDSSNEDSENDKEQDSPKDKENLENVDPCPSNSTIKSQYTALFSTFCIRPNAGRVSKVGKSFAKLCIQEQVLEFIVAQSLSGPEMQRRRQVLSDLAKLMQEEYSACRVYPFGSFLTGLGDSTSDLDIYFDAFNLNAGNGRGGEQKHSFLHVLNTTAKHLRDAKTPENEWLCRRIFPIRSARVPIIQFTHWNGVNCDVSFDNMLALRNSQLVALYIALHPCVRPLLLLVRYWAKFHGFSGSMLIKNYSLVLMVLTFLGKLGVIPSLERLRWLGTELRKKEGVDRNPYMHDGWDSSFCNDIGQIKLHFPSTLDCELGAEIIIRLFGDFCKFYSNFNPSKEVVSPLVAELLPKNIFLAGRELQLAVPVFETFKRWALSSTANNTRGDFRLNSSLCVQDIFMLNYNTAGLTCPKTLFRFQVACHHTAEKIFGPLDGIRCLFDIFVTLPGVIQDRRFLQNYQNFLKATELRAEITGFVEKGTKHYLRVLENSDASKFNLHRLSSEEMSRRRSLLAGSKKDNEIAIFRPSSKFRSIFTTLFQYGKLNTVKGSLDIERKMRLFWISIAEDFLAFFWKCFALKVEKEQCVRRDFGLETEMEEEAENGDGITGTDNEGIEGGTTDNPKDSSDDGQVSHDPVQNEDGDTKKSPRFYLRLSKNLDKFLGSFTNLRKEENAKRKLDEIVEEEETLVYMRLKCSTMSFVWERREAILQQLQQPEAGAHENETGAKSSSKKLSNRKIRRITQPRNLAFEETYKLDPLELQTRVTQIIVNNHPIQVDKGKSVPLLGFNVMVKFDKRWMNENPAFFLIFEKDPSVPCKSYNEAINTITSVLSDVFPIYAFHRALKWLDNSGNLESESAADGTSCDKNKTDVGSIPGTFTADLEQFPSLS